MPGCALNEPENCAQAPGVRVSAASIRISSELRLMMTASFAARKFQALIDGGHEIIGGAGALFGAPASVVILGETSRPYLFQSHALLDGVLNPVAHDGNHVAVFHDVELVADAPVARDDVGAAFFFMLGNRYIDDVVESVDFALNAAAALHVDKRIAFRIEDIAGCNNVGAAEDHQAVAIGMRRRLPANFHRFLVEVDFLLARYVGVGGPSPAGRGRLLSSGSA